MNVTIEIFDIRYDFKRRYYLHLRLVVLYGFSKLSAIFHISILSQSKEAVRDDLVVF